LVPHATIRFAFPPFAICSDDLAVGLSNAQRILRPKLDECRLIDPAR
jgi:hypothetical protein